jgi:hypothetical protein
MLMRFDPFREFDRMTQEVVRRACRRTRTEGAIA